MKVFCLTTHRNKSRQEQILKNWADWDIKFIYGEDWRDLNIEMSQYEKRIFGLTCCLCGHIKIWEEIKDNDGLKLIIEDDAKPLPNINLALKRIEKTNYNIVKLYHTENKEDNDIFLLQHWVSTLAYTVRDTNILLKKIKFLGSPDRMLNHITKVYGITPICVLPDGPTTIEEWHVN